MAKTGSEGEKAVLSYSITAEYPVEWVQIFRNGVPVVNGKTPAGDCTDPETPAAP